MKDKIKLKLKIPVKQRMMIGSGFSDQTINRKSLRAPNGGPYIPGSTLKGIIRNECEKLVKLFDFPVISPHNFETLANFSSGKNHEYLIDHLFGSRFEGDKLFFSDALPAKEAEKIITEVISRNSIDRERRTAKDGHLFSTEYIRNMSNEGDYINYFSEINGYHQKLTEENFPPEYCFLLLGILNCSKIGGDKSTGAGWLDEGIKIESLEYNNKQYSQDDFLKEFLSYQFSEIKALIDLYREDNL